MLQLLISALYSNHKARNVKKNEKIEETEDEDANRLRKNHVRTKAEQKGLADSIVVELDAVLGRLAVPRRAHELVEHGPHLILGRHFLLLACWLTGAAAGSQASPRVAVNLREGRTEENLRNKIPLKFQQKVIGGTRQLASICGRTQEHAVNRASWPSIFACLPENSLTVGASTQADLPINEHSYV